MYVCARALSFLFAFLQFSLPSLMDWFYFFARYYSYNKSFKSMKSTRIFIYFHLIVISQLFGTFYALMRCFCAFLTHYSKQLIKAMRLPVNGNNYSVPFKCQTKKNKSTITTAQILTEICLFRMMKNTREHLSKSVLTFRFIFFFIISLKCITDIKRPTKKWCTLYFCRRIEREYR